MGMVCVTWFFSSNFAGQPSEEVLKKVSEMALVQSNATSSRSTSSVMDPKLKHLLQEFYSPYNKQLLTLLGNDQFNWGYWNRIQTSFCTI